MNDDTPENPPPTSDAPPPAPPPAPIRPSGSTNVSGLLALIEIAKRQHQPDDNRRAV